MDLKTSILSKKPFYNKKLYPHQYFFFTPLGKLMSELFDEDEDLNEEEKIMYHLDFTIEAIIDNNWEYYKK
jgi:hypothetical protein